MRIGRCVSLVATVAVAAFSQAAAQDPLLDPAWSPGVSVYERPRPPFEPAGHQVGQFLVFPSVGVAEYYDSNIFAESTGENDDFVTMIEPALIAEVRQQRLAIDGLLGARVSLFADNSSQDEVEYEGRVGARYRLAEADEISGALSHLRQVVSREDVDEGGGTGDPRIVYRVVGEAGYDGSRGRVFYGLDGRVLYNDFEQSAQRDRDRTVYDAQGLLGYRATPNLAPYVEPYVEYWNFDTAVDSNGFARDATRVGGRVGAEYEEGDLITLRAAVGLGRWEFDDARFGDEWVWSADVLAGWNVTPATTLKLGAGRDELQNSVAGSSLREVSRVRVGVEHAFMPNVLGFADAEFRHSDFNNVGREDDDLSLGLGGDYLIDRMFAVSAGYTFDQRDSNRPADFDRNVVWVGLRAQF